MRSLLRVAAWSAVTVIAPLTAVTATSATQSAHASSGGISLAIDSVSPRVARSDSTVVVTGTITNRTGAPLSGMSVQLESSAQQFPTRDEMDAYLRPSGFTPVTAVGSGYTPAARIGPGATVHWRAEFNVAVAGMSEFGVYPLQAGLFDPAGLPAATDKTLLPFLPSNAPVSKLKVAWVWPLIDQPYRQACTALTSNDLIQSLAGGGRLGTLLTAAAQHPEADLTLAIDPALVGDANTMTLPYQVAGPGWQPKFCLGATREPASKAAASWLTTLESVIASQPAVLTPYGNTDVAALAHHGLTAELKTAYRLGQEVAGQVLHRTFGTNMALPAGGFADQSVLTTLAATEHVTSVVLSSSEMPPANSTVFSPDDAVTSVGTGAGTPMNVLLADDTLTNLLRSANAGMSSSAEFALEQQFLAQTAMIASEAPDSSRSLVVSPPETWGPSLALADSLLSETSGAPWLQPVTLNSLAGSHDSLSNLARKRPPDTQIRPRELSGGYLTQVGALDNQLDMYKSMLYQAPSGYTMGLDEAIAATESSAWRGGGAAAGQGQALVKDCTAYLNHAQGKVKIITSAEIIMAGASGVLPVNIQNNLEQNVQVKLSASVLPVAKGGAPPLVVGRMDDVITIPAGHTVVEKIHVSSAPSGTTAIQLQLTNRNGTELPLTTATLTVHSTRYGQDILILIAGAIGLLVLTSLFRAGRRWLAAPGNVMTGAQDPTEAPDELADARRWADDT